MDKVENSRELDHIVRNEKEWRKHILYELRELRKENSDFAIQINTLKIKTGMISGSVGTFFGAVTGFIASLLANKL